MEVIPSSCSLSSDSCLSLNEQKQANIRHLHAGEALPNQNATGDGFMPSSKRVCLFLNYRFHTLSTLCKITQGYSPMLHKYTH